MDPRDPSQRPSIFKTPEPMDESGPTEPRAERPSPEQEPAPPPMPAQDFWADQPASLRPAGALPPEQAGPSRRLMLGIAFGGALLLLVIGGFVVLRRNARRN